MSKSFILKTEDYIFSMLVKIDPTDMQYIYAADENMRTGVKVEVAVPIDGRDRDAARERALYLLHDEQWRSVCGSGGLCCSGCGAWVPVLLDSLCGACRGVKP